MYINLKTGDILPDEDAFDYAKSNLDSLSIQDKYDFIDWYYSGNWLHKTIDELQEDYDEGIGAHYIKMILDEAIKGV